MRITFLGTGTSQGVPVIACDCEVCQSLDFRDKRLRVSIHLEIADKSFVIDTGPDFRQQMLRERVHKLDAIIFTHEHKDHTAGLDDVRAYNFFQQKDMPIYARPSVLEQIQQEFAYAFTAIKYPGTPQITLNEIHHNTPFDIEGVTFTPIEVLHFKLPVYGFRIGDFTYITDVNYISEEAIEKVRGSKIVVIGALRKEKHLSHFTLSEAIEVLEKIKPDEAYITHISHQMGLHRDVEEELPSYIKLAYDGLTLTC
ncbi:MBL fold metallo-hydrolase [Arcicella aquatica]|uniref:MBL fold metallo-hydrolase n=1 Tax=Arcicella aquatica TaxID=217141 RepID=A0ABU5QRD6_9BACT|nr:MBL fold metallo-hydrolase [Arcicella aquatica]MEA5259315.1 MBL fold metallo-hydrolase [Arcicella aquatica]